MTPNEQNNSVTEVKHLWTLGKWICFLGMMQTVENGQFHKILNTNNEKYAQRAITISLFSLLSSYSVIL